MCGGRTLGGASHEHMPASVEGEDLGTPQTLHHVGPHMRLAARDHHKIDPFGHQPVIEVRYAGDHVCDRSDHRSPGRKCGVQAMTSTPSSAARRAISSATSMSDGAVVNPVQDMAMKVDHGAALPPRASALKPTLTPDRENRRLCGWASARRGQAMYRVRGGCLRLLVESSLRGDVSMIAIRSAKIQASAGMRSGYSTAE